MTKYILQSGGVRRYPNELSRFIAELSNEVDGTAKVLMCFFANTEDSWKRRYQEWQELFNKHAPVDVVFSFELANLENFANQVSNCDILYIYGGDAPTLLERIGAFDIPKIWEGKVVATNSASSHSLSVAFWAADYRKIFDGLGVLPLKYIAHFNSTVYDAEEGGPVDWQKAYKELENYGDKSLPIHALKEGDFIVIEQ